MIKCHGCKQEKPDQDFWKGQKLCKPCAKDRQKNRWASRSPKKRLEQHLKYKYGVTHDEFLEAWGKQLGLCVICSRELPDLMVYENRRRGYAIDHNHDTGEFRGILCLKCNSLLGMADDSEEILMKAIKYLKERGSYSQGSTKG